MAKNSLVYSNARVKALENTFLTNEKIVRMAYSDGLEEGIKVLLESSYRSEEHTSELQSQR